MDIAAATPDRKGRVLIIAADAREAEMLTSTFREDQAKVVSASSPWLKDGSYISAVLVTELAGRMTPAETLHDLLGQAHRLLARTRR